jgi:hypothetical protein
MTFLWTRSAGAVTSTCQLCGMTTRSLSESAIYLTQRGHDAMTCQRRRAEAAWVVDPIERCRNGHRRAGNTSIDGRGNIVCLACRRDVYAAQKASSKSGEMLCATTVFGVIPGVETGRMGSAKTNRPTRERRTVLSTPSTTRKEAVDS